MSGSRATSKLVRSRANRGCLQHSAICTASAYSTLRAPLHRIKFRQWRYAQDRTRSMLDLEQQAEFKQAYVATQVLGATPVV